MKLNHQIAGNGERESLFYARLGRIYGHIRDTGHANFATRCYNADDPIMTLKQIILYPLYWWLKKYGYIEKPITPEKRALYRTLNKLN